MTRSSSNASCQDSHDAAQSETPLTDLDASKSNDAIYRDGRALEIQEASLTLETASDTFLCSKNDNRTHKPSGRRPTWLPRSQRSKWLWEYLSALLSVALTIALAAILYVFDGREIPKWSLGITLNALISLLSVFAKGAMLLVTASCIGQLKWRWFKSPRWLEDLERIDEASRGPWGALTLLSMTIPRHLVTLGALVTVLAMATDPFVQQIITYEQRGVAVPHSYAFTQRSQFYDTGYSVQGGAQQGPEPDMKAAIFNGLYAKSALAGPTPSCPTGNCTFPTFNTLAVCSKCANVTNSVNRTSYTDVGWSNDTIIPGEVWQAVYQLPGNVHMNISWVGSSETGETPVIYGQAMTSQTSFDTNEMGKTLFGVPDPFLSLAILHFSDVDIRGTLGGYYNKSKPVAWECVLHLCINTYNLSIVNNQVDMRQISSWHDTDANPNRRYIEGNEIEDYDFTSGFSINGTLVLPDSERSKSMDTASRNSTFRVSSGTLWSISDFLNFTLAGSVLLRASQVIQSDGYQNDVLSLMNQTSDISSLFNNLSASMSSYLRAQASGVGSQTLGIAYRDETFVNVRWAWLILPVVLVLMSIVLLAATVWTSTQQRDPVWKSSILAAVYHSLDTRPVQRGPELDTMAQMQLAAKCDQVVLRPSEGGDWKLDLVDGKA